MRVVLAARPLSWPLALAAGHQEPEAASFCKNLVAQGQCGKRGRFSGFWRLGCLPHLCKKVERFSHWTPTSFGGWPPPLAPLRGLAFTVGAAGSERGSSWVRTHSWDAMELAFKLRLALLDTNFHLSRDSNSGTSINQQ